MFPPKCTANPQELLNNLWGSVQRAGPVFTEEARVMSGSDVHECSIQLAPGVLSADVRSSLQKYMRSYAKESGWKLSKLRFERGYLAFSIEPSSALSNASQNPRAKP